MITTRSNAQIRWRGTPPSPGSGVGPIKIPPCVGTMCNQIPISNIHQRPMYDAPIEPVCLECYLISGIGLIKTVFQIKNVLTATETDRIGLPPPGIDPPVANPQDLVEGPSTQGFGKSLWDPNGGEWRYDVGNEFHNPHWDYNPWTQWNSPWQNVQIGDLPPVKPNGP